MMAVLRRGVCWLRRRSAWCWPVLAGRFARHPAAAPLPGAASPPAAGSGADAHGQYIIGPGDVLSIFVYQAPPLSVTDLPVRPDGRISVPLVADVVAAGKTPSELGHDIAESLKKFVNDPNVTVMVHSFQGPSDRQVRVIGEATDPQAIPYRENMSLLDVMIATKGLTKFAAGNRAVIVRKDGAIGEAHTRAFVRSDQGRGYQPEYDDAARRHAYYSAELFLESRGGPAPKGI